MVPRPQAQNSKEIAMRGSRPGERRGGRQKGTPNKKTALRNAVIAARSANENLTPLDVMLAVIRDPQVSLADRVKMALKALPRLHRKPKAGQSGNAIAGSRRCYGAKLRHAERRCWRRYGQRRGGNRAGSNWRSWQKRTDRVKHPSARGVSEEHSGRRGRGQVPRLNATGFSLKCHSASENTSRSSSQSVSCNAALHPSEAIEPTTKARRCRRSLRL